MATSYKIFNDDGVFGLFNTYKSRALAIHYVAHQVNGGVKVYTPNPALTKKALMGSDQDLIKELDGLTLRAFYDHKTDSPREILELLAKAGIFKLHDFSDDQFVDWVIHTKKQSSKVLRELGAKELKEVPIEKVGGFNVKWLPGMKDKDKGRFRNLFKEIENNLKNHGLGEMARGLVILSNLEKSVAGRYFPADDSIHICLSTGKEHLDVIYHEIGHRFDHHHKLRKIITELYNENISQTSSTRDNLKGLFDFGEIYTVEDERFTGKKYRYSKLGPKNIILEEIAPGGKKSTRTLTVPFSLAEKLRDSKGKPPVIPKERSSALFPTEYSKTSAGEWFAEIFAIYLQDLAKPELKKFFEMNFLGFSK